MIIVTATMWPRGNQMQARELMNMTLTNQGRGQDAGTANYGAHIVTRPDVEGGIFGVEADVEIAGHVTQDGFYPLIISTLASVLAPDGPQGMRVPPSRVLEQHILTTAAEYEHRLKAGQ